MTTLGLAAGCALGGCANDSAEDEGLFTVVASLIESCADEGLLAAPATQTTRVWLRQVTSRSMHWDDGSGRLIGSYDEASREFAVQRTIVADMRAPDSDQPPCSIARTMRVDGVLDGSPVEAAEGFEGVQRFDYAPTDGSSCADLLTGPGAIAESLPCAVVYELAAERE